MLMIREIMYCKPGKVKPLIEKFVAMAALMEKAGMGKMRIMTDYAGEQYWTIISQFEVENMAAFDNMMSGNVPQDPEVMKKMEELMKGYHDLVDHGRREIFKLEN